MALIDLSRFDVQAQQAPVDKQVFADNGAEAYKAMAGLGFGVAKVATELYAKHQDVLTDKESNDALDQYTDNYAKKSQWAMNNIDPKTDLVAGTDKHYADYMKSVSDDLKGSLSEGITEDMSRGKFMEKLNPLERSFNVAAIDLGSKKTVENTLTQATQRRSSGTDIIRNSANSDILTNLTAAQSKAAENYALIDKTAGVATRQKIQNDDNKYFMETAVQASLRNALNGDTDLSAFGAIMGNSIRFDTNEKRSKFVQQKYEELGGKGQYTSDPVFKKTIDSMISEVGKNVNLPAIEGADQLSIDDKNQYMHQLLKAHWKVAQTKTDNVAAALKDFKANYGAIGTDTHIQEFGKLVNDPHFEGGPEDKVRLLEELGTNALKQHVKQNFAQIGGAAYDEAPAQLDQFRQNTVNKYLAVSGITPEQYAQIKKTTSVGQEDLQVTMNDFRKEQQTWHKQVNSNPMAFLADTPEYTNHLMNSFPIKNGKITVDPVEFANTGKYIQESMHSLGSLQSSIDSSAALPDRQMRELFKNVQALDPNSQMDFYKNINKGGGPLAIAFYDQLEKLKLMDSQTINSMSQLSLGDSPTRDAQNAEIIATRNVFTKEHVAELEKTLKVQGTFGHYSFKDVAANVDDELQNNQYLKDLRAAAKSSGLTEAQIKNLWQDKDIKLLALKKIFATAPEDEGIFSRLTHPGKLNRIISDSVDEVAKTYLGTRIQPIIGDNIKAVTLPGAVDEDKVKKGATDLTTRLQKALEENQLKINFDDYKDTPMGKRWANTDPSFAQRSFMRELVSKVSLSGIDSTGRDSTLVAGYTDPNGKFYRLRIQSADGQSYKALTIPNARKLQYDGADKVFADMTKGMIQQTPIRIQDQKDNVTVPNENPLETTLPFARNSTAAPNLDTSLPIKDAEVDSAFKFLSVPGRDNFKGEPYPSPEGDGTMTVGYGHKITSPEEMNKYKDGISEEDAKKLAYQDLGKARDNIKSRVDSKMWSKLTPNQRMVLVDMKFNLNDSKDHPALQNTIDLINANKIKEAGINISKISMGKGALPGNAKRTQARVQYWNGK